VPDRSFSLIDERLVEDAYFLRREIEPPILKSPAPLLGPAQGYGSVLRDRAGEWRMYYLNGRHVRGGARDLDRFEYRECFARSADGVRWETPSLGLIEQDGSRDHNWIMGANYRDATGRDLTGASGPEGFCVIDAETTPFPHARGRFTVLYLAQPENRVGICLAHSDDGLRWRGYPENPVISGWHDTQSVVFYDPRCRRYRLYMRPPVYANRAAHANRKIALAESDDLVRWSIPRVVLDTDEADGPAFAEFAERPDLPPRGRVKQFYGLTAFPWEDGYVGLAWLYDVPPGRIAVELVHSPDGVVWRREPGRDAYLADGRPAGLAGTMVVTFASPPVPVGDELWFYVSASLRIHHEKHSDDPRKHHRPYLLAVLRGRWVGYRAGEREGELLTRALPPAERPTALNLRLGGGGEAAVEVCDDWGQPLAAGGETKPLTLAGPIDGVSVPIDLAGQVPPGRTAGPLRMRIRLRRGTIFGWSSPNGPPPGR